MVCLDGHVVDCARDALGHRLRQRRIRGRSQRRICALRQHQYRCTDDFRFPGSRSGSCGFAMPRLGRTSERTCESQWRGGHVRRFSIRGLQVVCVDGYVMDSDHRALGHRLRHGHIPRECQRRTVALGQRGRRRPDYFRLSGCAASSVPCFSRSGKRARESERRDGRLHGFGIRRLHLVCLDGHVVDCARDALGHRVRQRRIRRRGQRRICALRHRQHWWADDFRFPGSGASSSLPGRGGPARCEADGSCTGGRLLRDRVRGL